MRGKRLGALAPPCDGVRLGDMSTDHQTRACALHGEPNSLVGRTRAGWSHRPYPTHCLPLWRPSGMFHAGQGRLFGLFGYGNAWFGGSYAEQSCQVKSGLNCRLRSVRILPATLAAQQRASRG